MSASSEFTAGKLKGHKGSVTCIQTDSSQQSLISGSEDQTVRLWDLRTNRTTKCMTGCFAGDIEAVRYGYDKNIVHVASSNAVYSFDLRFEGLLIRDATSQVLFSEGTDEVSNIALNAKGDTMAVAMDSGVINILSMKTNGIFCENAGATRYKRLTRVHSNIVSSINFKKNNPRELLSGGFDYIGSVWDIDKGRPKVSNVFQIIQPTDTDGEGNNKMQMINPPFVMHMNYMMDGRCIAAALGDGTIRVLNSKDLSPNAMIEAHNCMVTALYTDNEHIVSGGTDCTIHGYSLSTTSNSNNTSTSDKKASSGGAGKKKAPVPLAPLVVQPVRLFSIAHSAKINALACEFDCQSPVTASAESLKTDGKCVPTRDGKEDGEREGEGEEAASESLDSKTVFDMFRHTQASAVKVYVADLTKDITIYSSSR